MIRIIIPTANRPEFLRNALKSIAEQSIVRKISSVLVSENGGNKNSELICKEFPDLPINYIFRDIQIGVVEHSWDLINKSNKEPFIAILHDDDWWGTLHLEQAIFSLIHSPNSVLYSAGVFEVSGDRTILRCDNNFCSWFGCGFPPISSIWNMNFNEVALASLIHTPMRYSAMVARSNQLKRAFSKVLETGNPFDADRMLAVEFARLGDVVFNPIPQVFIRSHPNQDQWSFEISERVLHTAKTTEWIVAQLEESPEEFARKFVHRVGQCPIEAQDELRNRLLQPWCLPRLSQKFPLTNFHILYDKLNKENKEMRRVLSGRDIEKRNFVESVSHFFFSKINRVQSDIVWWSKNWRLRLRNAFSWYKL